MSNTPEVPEYLRQGPLADAAARALADTASMASSSMSVPRISLRGREFRFIEGGDEVAKFRDEISVIIFGVEPQGGLMVKTFYKDGYKQGSKEPPTCSSDDGIAPSSWVTNKQAQTCSACPNNRFGSATSPSGKATKACRDSKRVWLARTDDPKPIAERTLYGLNVTVASLKAFAEHGRKLSSLGVAPCVAVTKIKMVDSEFPQVEFELGGWLPVDQAQISLDISNKRPWKALSGLALAFSGDDSGGGRTIGLPGGTVAPPTTTVEQPVQQSKQVTNINEDLNRW